MTGRSSANPVWPSGARSISTLPSFTLLLKRLGVSLLSAVLFLAASASHARGEEIPKLSPLPEIEEIVPSDEVVRQALKDTLYYNFDKWFEIFEKQIARLEAAPPSLPNRMKLMKYHFYYSGLLGEFCHTLAFTSKYKVPSVAEEFAFYSHRAKDMANDLLAQPDLTREQQAETYMFLGAVEGYIGIFEYGEGNLLTALVNGLQADNHLEKALELNPSLVDAHFGLGIYRYGNSRLGGIGNFLMQGGRDLREEGLNHIEASIKADAPSTPLAMKTLIWFYISEQINQDNAGLSPDHRLSPLASRARAIELMEEMKSRYFTAPPVAGFKGNKQLAMMQALQAILDGDYPGARKYFEQILEISTDLKNKRNYKINPQLIESVQAGIEFSDLMIRSQSAAKDAKQVRSACNKVGEQIDFLKGGGSMVEYDTKKIRGELHDVFESRLIALYQELNCGQAAPAPDKV